MNTRGVFVLITCLAILMSVMCWLLVSPIQSAQGETVINRLSFGIELILAAIVFETLKSKST